MMLSGEWRESRPKRPTTAMGLGFAPLAIVLQSYGENMAIHDWTKVDAGIFHDLHHEWMSQLKRALNQRILPPDYYTLAEQIAGQFGPDVLTLERPSTPLLETNGSPANGIMLAATQPLLILPDRELERGTGYSCTAR